MISLLSYFAAPVFRLQALVFNFWLVELSVSEVVSQALSLHQSNRAPKLPNS